MEMVPVQSSIIDSIGYNDAEASLIVVFRDGYVYELHMVPRHIFEQFVDAPSKGSFFKRPAKDRAVWGPTHEEVLGLVPLNAR